MSNFSIAALVDGKVHSIDGHEQGEQKGNALLTDRVPISEPNFPFNSKDTEARDQSSINYMTLLYFIQYDVKHSESGEFFLQQFRRPKRIRTAFSHSQLLQLEEAFDHNNYLVGPERKLLAQKLELSETQIKVWFQNRRTKRRRLLSEEASRISSTFETLVDK